MNKSAQIVRNQHDLVLVGAVNLHTVGDLYKEIRQHLSPDIHSLDCSSIQQCDSSAIGLLLASKRLSRLRGINLRIQGMGAQILSLARLYEVEPLLL